MEVVNKDIPRHYVWTSNIVDIARRLVVEADAIIVEISSVETSLKRALGLISALDINLLEPLTVVLVLSLSDCGPQIIWKAKVVVEAAQRAAANRSRAVLKVEDMHRKPIFSTM